MTWISHGGWFLSNINADGTIETNTSGDQITRALDTPITIQPGAVGAVLPVKSTAWHSVPNVSPSLGNQFRYTAPGAEPNPGTYTDTLPTSLYTLPMVQDAIARPMAARGHGTVANPIFKLEGIKETQKIQIQISTIGYSIDFTIANSIAGLLGYTAIVITSTVANEIFTGANPADFAKGTSSVIVHISLTSRGNVNGVSGSAVMAIAFSTTTPLRQVEAANLTQYTMPLNTGYYTDVTAYLTNQSGKRVSLNGQDWSLQFEVRSSFGRKFPHIFLEG